ncbi:MAG: hypothetical protein ACRENK_13750 [Gemmatimonadaceae bacterium]
MCNNRFLSNNRFLLLAIALTLGSTLLQAQTATTDCSAMQGSMDHANMDPAMHSVMISTCNPQSLPTQPGQAAYGAIAQVVQLLEADSSTDWTRVDVEALRQHLIDMDDVTLRSVVTQRDVGGGFEANVTGSGRTIGAIRRMLKSHATMLDRGTVYHASTKEIPNGSRLVITAVDPRDDRGIARIRGLGFAGMLTEGNHHAAHHIALARGDTAAHGQ